MATRADVKSLIDWCTLPSPGVLLTRVVGAHLMHSYGEGGSWDSWHGFLHYVPPRGKSTFFTSNFYGVLQSPIVATGRVSVAIDAGEHNILSGLQFHNTYGNHYYEEDVADASSWSGIEELNLGNGFDIYLYGSISYYSDVGPDA